VPTALMARVERVSHQLVRRNARPPRVRKPDGFVGHQSARRICTAERSRRPRRPTVVRRLRGECVRFLSGTDEHSLKNVQAAAAAGLPVADFVAAKAQRFAALREPLELSVDDFIRTSRDPRHRPGVERLWRACADREDLYERYYEGLYCTGCEAFLSPGELADALCPEHGRPPERVAERNWFFRLSRYSERLLELIESGRLRIEPQQRRNEALAFIREGLEDFSVSRSQERAHGWGIPVPGDPSQVIYVWFDALGNYISALDYAARGERYRQWWQRADDRVHVIGKGIIRFHAIYWPAILLSAGEPLPTALFVHDYLTADGHKLSKSLGAIHDPADIAARYGTAALRWWFARDVPRTGDTDFREDLVAARANELADGLGNLVNRTITLVARYRPRGIAPVEPRTEESRALHAAIQRTPNAIDAALWRFDIRSAATALWSLVEQANRYVEATRPWQLAKLRNDDGNDGADDRLDEVLGVLISACRTLTHEFQPFLPASSERIRRALHKEDPELGRRLFPKVT
jgi:methionyl-tRNA synthetase